jgi:Zn-finger nucleic acid-binding protein
MVPVCPRCHAALFLLRYEGVEVDHCPACRGFWLDAGEIEELAGAVRGAPLADGLKRALRGEGRPSGALCPRCDAQLEEFAADLGPVAGAGALRLDRCPRGHGLWFDAGELPRLFAALPSGPEAEALARALPAIFGKHFPAA